MNELRVLRFLVLAGFAAASACAPLSSSPPKIAEQLQVDLQESAEEEWQNPETKPGRDSQAREESTSQESVLLSQQPHDGKYYLDDGPPDDSRVAFADIADAVPRIEKINPIHNRPYSALGKRFVPDTAPRKYRKRGMASWYGKRYHGRKTSTGEVYDMFKMTAAHPTLAIPSYARVTRVSTGESVVVRINDRGPFLGGRIIDLSFAAAGRLGFVKDGTAEVIVETILPNDNAAAADNNNKNESAAIKVEERRLYVQFGAFSLAANADKFRAELSAKTSLAAAVVNSGGFYRVVAGPYKDRYVAESVRDDLCADGWCGLIKELP